MKKLAFLAQAALAYALWGLFKALPVDAASAVGGWLAGRLGPLVKAHRIADANLRRALPELDDAARAAVLRGMWDNLGRTVGELPHLARICDPAAGRVALTGADHVALLRDDGKPGLLLSGHLGNWQLQPFIAAAHGLVIHVFYRAPNNPYVDPLFRAAHRGGGGEMLPKGRDGAKRSLALLRTGGHLGMLVDQKMNDGLAVPFFGRLAMTATAPAQLAQKFGCPMVPARVVRLGGCRFRIDVEPPLEVPDGADLVAAMTMMNARLEAWIREYPEQWLWAHRRWPD